MSEIRNFTSAVELKVMATDNAIMKEVEKMIAATHLGNKSFFDAFGGVYDGNVQNDKYVVVVSFNKLLEQNEFDVFEAFHQIANNAGLDYNTCASYDYLTWMPGTVPFSLVSEAVYQMLCHHYQQKMLEAKPVKKRAPRKKKEVAPKEPEEKISEESIVPEPEPKVFGPEPMDKVFGPEPEPEPKSETSESGGAKITFL